MNKPMPRTAPLACLLTPMLSLALCAPAAFAQQGSISLAAPTETPAPAATTAAPAANTPSTTNRTASPNPTASAETVAASTDNPPVPTHPHDPNAPTLLEMQAPDDNELSAANTALLAKNAELERQIDTLTTQNNVLVQERSGQLFMYGAMTAIASLLLGFMLSRLLTRKDRW